MNSTDLIERAEKSLAWVHPVKARTIIRELITALSPVMPPEVDAAIKFYRDPEQGANRITANLLEKLSRKNEELDYLTNLQDKASDTLHAKCVEQRERIEELEPKYQLERQGSARMSEEILKLESQRDQLERLINQMLGDMSASEQISIKYIDKCEDELKRIMHE